MAATPSPITEAIAAAGGVMRLAERLGLSHPSILRWQRSGKVPAERVAAVEAATGVPRERLRPDLFPPIPGVTEAQALRAEKIRRWQAENRAAMDAQNEWVERNGLPLAKYRLF